MDELNSDKMMQNPLTGLPNFFAFLKANSENVYRDSGSIIIFDMVKFAEFNESYGMAEGDKCLTAIGRVIQGEVKQLKNISLFHTTGDEFTVILPERTKEDADALIEKIDYKFKTEMAAMGYMHVNFHILAFEYKEKISSASDFYKLKYRSGLNTSEKFKGETLLDDIVWRFEENIKSTLSYLEKASNLALTDDVSGLKNHRAAKQHLENMMLKRSSDTEIAILFIDGDNLKRYNEISYQAGNQMIRDLSNMIKDSLRADDKVFRWLSGDEFLVILNGTGSDDAYKLSERIRKHIGKTTNDWHYPITISTGVSVYPEDGKDLETIISNAEKSNAYAKKMVKIWLLCGINCMIKV